MHDVGFGSISVRSMRAVSVVLLIVLWLSAGSCLRAQNFDATHIQQPVELNVTWLVHGGDDPSFASPQLNDSQWLRFDPMTAVDRVLKSRPEVIWYRLHVKVDPAQRGLALDEMNISRAFEIYVNGERLLANGRVSPFSPYSFAARERKRIPEWGLASGNLVIAIRVHISPSEWNGQGAGFYATNLEIGQASTLYIEDWMAIIGANSMTWLDQLLVIAIGLIALVLYSSQRQQKEYLWITAMGAMQLVECPVSLITTFHNIPVIWVQLTDMVRVVTPYVWGSFYLTFLRQRVGWGWKTYFIIAGVMNAFSGMQEFMTVPLPLQFLSNLPFVILLSVIMPIVLAVHWRRGNREAGILLIPALLFSLYIYAEIGFDTLFQIPAWRQAALRGLNLIDRYPAGPFAVSLDHIAGILSTLSLAVIILLRSSRMSRRQARLENELAAAQQVQKLLVPEKIEGLVGFHVESIYEPAQEVGGDFFQILPARDAGLLLLVGDVAGKGLPAAMLVSVLVGAIRSVAEFTGEPAELLEHLNEKLVGRSSGGFSTALVAHITSNGNVTIANAGHLPPYLEGKELELPGALPLGVASGVQYPTAEFLLQPGGRLTFYSDGVVEAQNSEGELFGFARAQQVSTQSAAAIVEAAKRFGQQDDITVVTIERAAAVATAA